jgi:hypothetical protein
LRGWAAFRRNTVTLRGPQARIAARTGRLPLAHAKKIENAASKLCCTGVYAPPLHLSAPAPSTDVSPFVGSATGSRMASESVLATSGLPRTGRQLTCHPSPGRRAREPAVAPVRIAPDFRRVHEEALTCRETADCSRSSRRGIARKVRASRTEPGSDGKGVASLTSRPLRAVVADAEARPSGSRRLLYSLRPISGPEREEFP